MLTTNHFFTLAVVTSQFMLLYTLFHCIPFRSLVFRALGGDPWELFSKSHLQQLHQDTCYWSSGESDTVVYDPENLHWSSSSLSTYLDEVHNQDGVQFTQPPTKPTRHTWVWTSDEDSQDESYDDGVSGNDAGYMTETTTESGDSSCYEIEESVEIQQYLPNSSTEMISMKVEAVDQVMDMKDDMMDQVLHGKVDAKVSESVVGGEVLSSSSFQEESANVEEGADDISVVKIAPNADVASTNGTDVVNDTDDVVLHSDSLQVFDRVVFCEDVDGFQDTQMTDGEDCCRNEVNNFPGSYEKPISTDGILQSKAVKLGLLAAGVGIGAYIVYKLCIKK
ncbi:uncharacterized protein LOC116305593 isoform X1 [Actinia tenebrosa]|uniref:Uncharacterized protein LOC116305593 isoform X1 n=1 Tax=Actinia tenebrosa TaxID=6105 RepID=A0A6P8IWG6_ACTTE|nr:uncharacterized protein LOC116305593 isoform X1 [Actinia tenebrosa]